MADVIVLIGVAAFLAACVVYVRGCDRIIGPDAPESAESVIESVDLPSVPGAR